MLRNRLKFNYTFERIIFILLIVIQFVFLDASPVYILDESKFAEAAREMLVTGNYWIPTFNGSLFVDKPPMQYFFMMLGFKIFGINAFGARFFSAVIGLLTVLLPINFPTIILEENRHELLYSSWSVPFSLCNSFNWRHPIPI